MKTWAYTLLWVLLAAVACMLAILIWRVWKNHQQKPTIVISSPIKSKPDLTDENIDADELPADNWWTMGQELLKEEKLRLALRAFYLSSLAYLGQQELILIAKFKSNYDYKQELGRRAHNQPQILPIFIENVATFERIWYGKHEVNLEIVNQFVTNQERMMDFAEEF